MFFWNISDIRITDKIKIPLETDSMKITEEIGFKYVESLKMLMRNFPGRDTGDKMKKMVDSGLNFINTDNKWVKYEPVFVYKK